MSVRFLLFSGNWENEGNFHLLETEKSIIILATGKVNSSKNLQEQQIGRDYLKEKKSKVKVVIINNTNFQNIGLLVDICSDLGVSIPIYASFHSKLIISYLFPSLKNRIIIPEKNHEVKIEDLSLSFFPIGSYLIGNLALAIHCYQYSFYFVEDFLFSNLLENNLLFPAKFLTDFQQFLIQKKKNTYLITSCQSMHWQNNNSLFFATQNFPEHVNKSLFFILYDFDWLHILELLEIMRNRGKTVRILNEEFNLLIGKVLSEDKLHEVIKNSTKKDENEIYLLVANPEDIRNKLNDSLDDFSSEKKSNFHFVVGIPPLIGGEVKLAGIIDYLYTQSETITNLSKKEYLNLGLSFYDFKLLIKLLQPSGTITLQNSYKNEKFFNRLPSNFLTINNGYSWDFPTNKTSQLRGKKTLISLEELLVKQRENLGQNGLLVILLIIEWKEKKLRLKTIKIENLAVNSMLNITKLENKINDWWETKLVPDIKKSDPLKIIKKTVEKRVNGLVRSYLNLKCGIDLGESLFLLFN